MSKFHVQAHRLPTCHIREYPQALADDQEDELQIEIKQYTPIDNRSPKAGDVTIIGAHANAFPKVPIYLIPIRMHDIPLKDDRNSTSLYGMSFISD
jgi:hypothetical protein